MEAVDVLYGSGDKLSRDIAYSEAMQHLHEVFPEDDEIATLYALSLLGTVRRGDRGFGRQMRAGAIALEVFARNPQHPGAAHFIVHAYDDPEHAIRALPAAKVYAEIAPAAPHALHMPSHIFVQLGMWEGVVASNDASYKAALDHVERKGLERGRSEYHALQWYHYGQLQLGNKEMARWALDEAFRTLETFPTTRVRRGTMRMLAPPHSGNGTLVRVRPRDSLRCRSQSLGAATRCRIERGAHGQHGCGGNRVGQHQGCSSTLLRERVNGLSRQDHRMLCPGCVSHGLPQAMRVHRVFNRDEVAVVGLHTVFEHHDAQGSRAALAAFLHEYKITFPVGIDAPSDRGGLPKNDGPRWHEGNPDSAPCRSAGALAEAQVRLGG